jgi:hypothetical protein
MFDIDCPIIIFFFLIFSRRIEVTTGIDEEVRVPLSAQKECDLVDDIPLADTAEIESCTKIR